MGVRPQPFSAQSALVYYISNNIELEKTSTLTTFFAESPPDSYLLEIAKKLNIKTIYIPHGLTQISAAWPCDYVLALTKSTAWRHVFPHSHVVHLGWPEITKSEKNVICTKKDTRTKVQFLSQITGERIHRLEDLITVVNFFLNEALKLECSKYTIDIRLRNIDELNILDTQLVNESKKHHHISFSSATDYKMEFSDADILISSSSTGLLYSQHLNIPAIMLTTNKISEIWPYELTFPEHIYNIEKESFSFSDFIGNVVRNGKAKLLYSEPNINTIDKMLNHIYC